MSKLLTYAIPNSLNLFHFIKSTKMSLLLRNIFSSMELNPISSSILNFGCKNSYHSHLHSPFLYGFELNLSRRRFSHPSRFLCIYPRKNPSRIQTSILANSDAIEIHSSNDFHLKNPTPQFSSSNCTEGLSSEQMAVVLSQAESIRVVAGPGSGKTRVLTRRVAHLILDKNVPPSRIMCITFTNKSAMELQERLKQLMDSKEVAEIQVGTFHSQCAKILRKVVNKHPLFHLSRNFVIYDEDDVENVVRNILHEMDCLLEEKNGITDGKNTDNSVVERTKKVKGKKESEIKAETIKAITALLFKEKKLKFFKFLKEKIDFPAAWELDMDPFSEILENRFSFFFEHHFLEIYEKKMRENNAVDFDDLIFHVVNIFHSFPNTGEVFRNKYDHVLVDEFQDTDTAQFELVRFLCSKSKNLFVVGDIDQAIYGFRGADPRNMHILFDFYFPNNVTYQLRDNYRSSKPIIDVSNSIIEASEVSRLVGTIPPLKMNPIKLDGVPVRRLQFRKCRYEAAMVVREIERLVQEQNYSWKQCAILYRNKAISRLFEVELSNRSIPYIVHGSTSFFLKKEIKDILAYLRLIINPSDDIALQRIINIPARGIGSTTVSKLKFFALESKKSLSKALFEYGCSLQSMEDLKISSKTKKNIQAFCEMMNAFRMPIHLMNDSEFEIQILIDHIISEIDYFSYLETFSAQDNSFKQRKENIQSLIKMAIVSSSDGLSLQGFVEKLSLLSDIHDEKNSKSSNAVHLSTIHSAKGLEFENVFLVALEEDILPFYLSSTEKEIAEERRVLYVGMTRARDRLYLSHVNSRCIYGTVYLANKSRFIP